MISQSHIPTFYHSGEIGDILYALKATSRFPRTNLYLNVDLQLLSRWPDLHLANPNKLFNFREYTFIRKLLERQPYLQDVVFGTPQQMDFNLNFFRHSIFHQTSLNFSDLFLDVCNLKINKDDAYMPWLFCDVKREYPITAIRVSRRTNNNFPWRKIVDKYKNDIIFLGTKSEYIEFTEYTGKMVAWKNYTDMLSICEIINGAKLHIGNCTSITVCAEALKKPMIFEHECDHTHIRYATHQFYRHNRFNFDTDMIDPDIVMEKINTFLGY
jgi:hypothetical protein